MTTASEPTAATARRPWYQSIAGNLLLAFALIVALTVSASLLSLIRFNQIDAVMNRLTGVSLPLVQSSLGVEAKTAELVVLATELSKAENEVQQFILAPAGTPPEIVERHPPAGAVNPNSGVTA